jgi:hypothetical protein
MEYCRRRLDFATSFGFFPHCEFQQNLPLIEFQVMMRNLVVEFQNVGKQLSRNLLIMRTALRE